MRTAFRMVLLAAAIGVGFWIWFTFFPSPQRAVRNQLTKLARLASNPANEGNVKRAIDLERLATLFSEDVHITLAPQGMEERIFDGRSDIMQSLSYVKSSGLTLKAEFLDMNVEMDTGNLSALVDLTLKAKIEGQSDLIAQELKVTLKKIKGDWLITRAETVMPLKP